MAKYGTDEFEAEYQAMLADRMKNPPPYIYFTPEWAALYEKTIQGDADYKDAAKTWEGTVVLHVAPESAAGGPLSLLRDGDMVVLDVPRRRLDVDVPGAEWAAREPSERAAARYAAPTRGWERLYVDHVQQADTGADLDFLVGSSGDRVTRESH